MEPGISTDIIAEQTGFSVRQSVERLRPRHRHAPPARSSARVPRTSERGTGAPFHGTVTPNRPKKPGIGSAGDIHAHAVGVGRWRIEQGVVVIHADHHARFSMNRSGPRIRQITGILASRHDTGSQQGRSGDRRIPDSLLPQGRLDRPSIRARAARQRPCRQRDCRRGPFPERWECHLHPDLRPPFCPHPGRRQNHRSMCRR